MSVSREVVIGLIGEILARSGTAPVTLEDGSVLREIGFQSLDFAELALRVEALAGCPLDFDGMAMRAIRSVGDVVAFFTDALVADSGTKAD